MPVGSWKRKPGKKSYSWSPVRTSSAVMRPVSLIAPTFFFAGSEKASKDALFHRSPTRNVRITGIPAAASFRETYQSDLLSGGQLKAEMKAGLGIRPDAFTVLISGGGRELVPWMLIQAVCCYDWDFRYSYWFSR